MKSATMLLLSAVELSELRKMMETKKIEVESAGGEFIPRLEHGQKFKDKNDADKIKLTGAGKDGIFAHGIKQHVYYDIKMPEMDAAPAEFKPELVNSDQDIRELEVKELKAFISFKEETPKGNKTDLVEQALKLL